MKDRIKEQLAKADVSVEGREGLSPHSDDYPVLLKLRGDRRPLTIAEALALGEALIAEANRALSR